jgi:hypothetical protein
MPKTLAQREANMALGNRVLASKVKAAALIELADILVNEVSRAMTPADRAEVLRAIEPQLADLERKISMLHRYASRRGKDAASTSPAVTPVTGRRPALRRQAEPRAPAGSAGAERA